MRRRSPELVALVLLAGLPLAAAEPPAPGGKDASPPGFLDFGKGQKSKDPITITADNLEYAYQDGIVIYRGDVQAVQGDVVLHSAELRITLAKSDDPKANPGANANPAKDASEIGDTSTQQVREVVATGHVRIDQGTRWAVGGKATYEQSDRTVVLTENPVLHDGPNEVVGDRVIIYLDEDRSIVEGGHKRVKAVFFPNKDKDQGKPGDATKPGATPPQTAASAPGKPAATP
jgi:lipopolysaccharide export system protein LptA